MAIDPVPAKKNGIDYVYQAAIAQCEDQEADNAKATDQPPKSPVQAPDLSTPTRPKRSQRKVTAGKAATHAKDITIHNIAIETAPTYGRDFRGKEIETFCRQFIDNIHYYIDCLATEFVASAHKSLEEAMTPDPKVRPGPLTTKASAKKENNSIVKFSNENGHYSAQIDGIAIDISKKMPQPYIEGLKVRAGCIKLGKQQHLRDHAVHRHEGKGSLGVTPLAEIVDNSSDAGIHISQTSANCLPLCKWALSNSKRDENAVSPSSQGRSSTASGKHKRAGLFQDAKEEGHCNKPPKHGRNGVRTRVLPSHLVRKMVEFLIKKEYPYKDCADFLNNSLHTSLTLADIERKWRATLAQYNAGIKVSSGAQSHLESYFQRGTPSLKHIDRY